MFNGKEYKISSSLMDSYHWCARKFRIRNIEGIPSGIPPSPALRIGKVCHREIESFWKNYRFDLDNYTYDIEDYFKKITKKVRFSKLETNTTFQIYFSNFLQFQVRRLTTYIEEYGKDYSIINSLFYPIINEKYGKVRISNNVVFAFVVDSLFENPEGNFLIDWKTDNECTKAKFKKHVPQLNRYSDCLPYIGHSCKRMGVYFLKESLFFHAEKQVGYSIEKEVLDFVRMLQISKFPKVKKSEKWRCGTEEKSVCEYYPEICIGAGNKK